MDTLPDAVPLPDVRPGALPALRSLVLGCINLTSTLPASWGRPGVLPQLDELRVYLGRVAGALPPEWAAGGFRNLTNLMVSCQEGFDPRYDAPAATRAAAAAAAPAPRDALPPAWGAGAFPSLSSLTLVGLHVGGGLPASWLVPGAFPRLHQLSLEEMDLSGPLPEALFEANPLLKSVSLPNCLFTGTLPPRWGNSSVRRRRGDPAGPRPGDPPTCNISLSLQLPPGAAAALVHAAVPALSAVAVVALPAGLASRHRRPPFTKI